MNAISILFPFGVRLSTWLVLAVFLVLAVSRREWRPLLAAWTWLWGFEAAYDASVLLFRHPPASARPQPLFYLILGVTTVAWMTFRVGVRPALRPMLVVAAIWAVWVAIGFPVNPHDATTIDPAAEVLNEAAKTIWALAYLVPLGLGSGRLVALLRPGENAAWGRGDVAS